MPKVVAVLFVGCQIATLREMNSFWIGAGTSSAPARQQLEPLRTWGRVDKKPVASFSEAGFKMGQMEHLHIFMGV